MTVIGTDVIGIDVGGANLKYVARSIRRVGHNSNSTCNDSVDGARAFSTNFAMWRHPDRLADQLEGDLRRLAGENAAIDRLAITMTGELADCFSDRAVGVKHIVTHCMRAASSLGIEDVGFYGVDGRFRGAADAILDVDRVAAANWHAAASLVARDLADNGTLIDIGSTTTDIIPIEERRVATTATTDFDRLAEGSLVYVGCRRTPVCALLHKLMYRGQSIPVMNEVFATIDDARLLVGSLPEDDGDCDTADGKPRTKQWAANRIARMIGLDARTVGLDKAVALARQVIDAARQRIAAGRAQVAAQFAGASRWKIILSGHGEDLIEVPSDVPVIRLAEMLGPEISRCAPALAVASLYGPQGNRV